jgi:hypothetical protein
MLAGRSTLPGTIVVPEYVLRVRKYGLHWSLAAVRRWWMGPRASGWRPSLLVGRRRYWPWSLLEAAPTGPSALEVLGLGRLASYWRPRPRMVGGLIGTGWRSSSVLVLVFMGGRIRGWWVGPQVRTCGRGFMGDALAGALSWWRYWCAGWPTHAVVSSVAPVVSPLAILVVADACRRA